MSFSLRSMFGKEGSPPIAGSSAAFGTEATLGQMPTSLFADVPAMAGGSGAGSGGPLFRTLGEEMESFSEAASPFASAPEEALTVGDLLPHLPPELARSGAVSAQEPVRIAPAILSQALSSGQLAVPLFEVFRVSPGMFQSPVSPDDPRQVSLPPDKLPALIHAAAQAPAAPPASPFHPLPAVNSPAPASPFGQSPFAAAQAAPPVSPFGSLFAEADPQPPSPSEPARATSLPPRRDPAQPPASSLPPSPFLDTPSPFLETPAASAPPASPFAASPFAASPFAAAPSAATDSAPASPFAAFSLPAMPEAPAPAMGFSLFQEAQEAQPPPSPPATAAFGLPSQPAATPPSPFLDAAPAPAPVAKMSGPATASVAALLQGQSADALGFDPAMVPTWITTQFHGGTIAELQDQPSPTLDLGTIIDGITDIGFRNVLSSAKRGHTVPVPLDKLTPVGSPAPATSTVTPTSGPTPAIANPFMTVAAAPEPAPAVPNPFRIEPGNPFAQVPEAPAASTEPEPPPAPAPAAAAPYTVVPKPAGQHFIQPKADIEGMLSGVAPSPATPEAPPAPFTTLPPAKSAPKMIDPFAPTEPAAPAPAPSAGFSSFDLLGGAPAAAPAPAPEPAPTPTREAEPAPAPAATILPVEPPAPAPAPSPFFAAAAAIAAPAEPFETPAAPPPPPAVAAAASAPLPTPAPEPELTELPEFPAAMELPVVVEKPVATAPETPVDLPFIAATPAKSEPAPKESIRSFGGLPVQDLPFEDVSEPEPEPTPAAPAPPVSPPPAMPVATLPPRSTAPAKSALGVSAMESTGEEQLVLRALLDSDEDLDIQRVIDLTTALPGIAACALIRDERVLASSATKSAEAKAFRGQAADVAKNLRALAPLIGITDAETFTLNTDTRLITLCFPGAITLAVLHDREPSLGQRDKLTLIARQLERLSAHA